MSEDAVVVSPPPTAPLQPVAGPSSSSNLNEKVMSRLSQCFPDGTFCNRPYCKHRADPKFSAASLSRHQQVQAKLQLEIIDVKEEVSKLKAELKKHQDPGKMSRIQSQIGVSRFSTRLHTSYISTSANFLVTAPHDPDQRHQGESSGSGSHRQGNHIGHSETRYGQAESHGSHTDTRTVGDAQ